MAAKKNSRGLTPAQEKYCRERVRNGKTQHAAYKAAGIAREGTKQKSLEDSACRLEHKPEIMARLEELTQKAAEGAILDAKQMQAELTDVVLSRASERTEIRLKAMDQLAKMQGLYKDALQVSGGITINDAREALDELLE